MPDDQRKAFFRAFNRRVKDPDTYAVLNYLFVAGLHHFYLGRAVRGLCNLLVFVAGVVLIVSGALWFGLALILAITVWELGALFRAEVIVAEFNNQLMAQLLDDLHGGDQPTHDG